MNEGYPAEWKHGTIRWNPRTGEIHGGGDLSVFQMVTSLQAQLKEAKELLAIWRRGVPSMTLREQEARDRLVARTDAFLGPPLTPEQEQDLWVREANAYLADLFTLCRCGDWGGEWSASNTAVPHHPNCPRAALFRTDTEEEP